MIKIVYSNITMISLKLEAVVNVEDGAKFKANFQNILNLTFYYFLNLTMKRKRNFCFRIDCKQFYNIQSNRFSRYFEKYNRK